MELSCFPSTAYWRNCLFSTVYSYLLYHGLTDKCLGLFLGFLSCSINPYLTYKINSKWIKSFNVRSEIIKLLEENIGGKLLSICLGDFVFFELTPKAQITKAKINKQFSSVQFSHSVVSNSLRPHEPQHARPPCPSNLKPCVKQIKSSIKLKDNIPNRRIYLHIMCLMRG